MARLIQPTPTLQGEDAENFYSELQRKKTKEEINIRNKLFQESKSIFQRHQRAQLKN